VVDQKKVMLSISFDENVDVLLAWIPNSEGNTDAHRLAYIDEEEFTLKLYAEIDATQSEAAMREVFAAMNP
jgi:hypothetical protein